VGPEEEEALAKAAEEFRLKAEEDESAAKAAEEAREVAAE